MQDDRTASDPQGRDEELELLFQDTATPVKKQDGAKKTPDSPPPKPEPASKRSPTGPRPGRARVRPGRSPARRPAPKPRGDQQFPGPQPPPRAEPAAAVDRPAPRSKRPPSERLPRPPSERKPRPSTERGPRPPSERRSKRPPSERRPRPPSERLARPPSERLARPPSERLARPPSERLARTELEKTPTAEPASASAKDSTPEFNTVAFPAEEPTLEIEAREIRERYKKPPPSPTANVEKETELAKAPTETEAKLVRDRGFYDSPPAEPGPPTGSAVGTPITRAAAPLPTSRRPTPPPPPSMPRTPSAPPPRDPPARNPNSRPASERAILTARLPDRSSLRPPMIVVLYRRLPLILALLAILILSSAGTYALWPRTEGAPVAFSKVGEVPVWTNSPQVTVSGRLNQKGQLQIAGVMVATDPEGYFRRAVPLTEGANAIALEAGSAEQPVSRTLTVKLDTRLPRFEFEGQRDGRSIIITSRSLRGRVVEEQLAELSLDGQELEADADGRFEIPLAPTSAVQTLRLFARDKAGNQDGGAFQVRIETGLSFAALSELPSWTRSERLELTGKLTARAELSLNGAAAAVDADGAFALPLTLAPGVNNFELEARDADGGRARRSLKVIRDDEAPAVILEGESEAGLVTISGSELRGRVQDAIPAQLRIDGRAVTLAKDGSFRAPLVLGGQATRLLLIAEDALNNRSARTITVAGPRFLGVRFDPPLTEWTIDAVLDLRGVASRGPITARIGQRVIRSDADGRFRLRLPLNEGLNRFELVLDDNKGITTRRKIALRRDSKPPKLELEGARAEDWVTLRGGALRGQLIEDHLKVLRIDGAALNPDEEGRFAHPIAVSEGVREVEIEVIDQAGQRLRRRLVVGSARAVADDLGRCVLLDADLWREAPEDARVAAVARVTRQLGARFRFLGFEDFRCQDQAFRIATFVHAKTEAILHLIPGGRYLMGVQDGDPSAQPLHEVVIRPFLMGRSEVKQREWDAAAGADARGFRGAGLPIDGLSWTEAQAWLSRAGGGLRLPSESEWEYAARAGSTTRFYWGERMDDRYAWHRGNSAQNFSGARKTHPDSEHEKVANAFGLIDTLGNVWEWCQDTYRPGYLAGPTTNAARAGPGEDRVARGGSWRTDEAFCRSARRFHYVIGHRGSDVGLRVARSLDWPGEARVRLRVGVAQRDPMAILANREAWSQASASLQDAAIAEVGKRLSPYFQLAETRVYESGGARHRIATFLHERTGIRFQLLPGGGFTMGSNAGRDDEAPPHPVTLKPFLLAQSEVLQREWDVFGGADERAFKGAALPIDSVSWDAIQPWLRRAGNGFRLPSETEWEYAARAGTTTRFYWGQRWDDRYAWHSGNSDQNFSRTPKTHPASEHANEANAFGLVDMLGNVKEWCQDSYLTDYKTTPRTNAANEQGGDKRVVRGGSWYTERAFCRSAARYRHLPDHIFKDIGFRVAVSIPE